MKRNIPLLLLALVLVLVVLVLVSVAVRFSGAAGSQAQPTGTATVSCTEDATQDTQTDPTEDNTEPPTQSTTEPPTEAPTQAPTEAPTKPPVDSTGNDSDRIGSLYTRGELMAMENEEKGYGPGRTSGGKRAPYAEYDQQSYGEYGANFIAPDNGNIYLTFDCGYEYTATDANGNKYRVTEKILDILKEKDVKAVFFVTMYYVTDQPDLVQRMIDEGHVVGNHTNNHPVLPSLSIDDMVYEIMSLHEYVKEHFGYEMNLLRPPTGAYSTRTLALTKSLGYKTVHWSFAHGDYDTENQPDVASALELVTSSHHSGAIYLLHAISTTNAALLPDAIDFFRAEGYDLELFQ